jgi:hypothetical protein
MHKHSEKIREKDMFLWVNVVLFGMASVLLFYYVMMANSIASKNYKIQTLINRAEELSEVNSSLIAKKINLESPTALLEFARASNLVEAGDIVYIFENKNVARR